MLKLGSAGVCSVLAILIGWGLAGCSGSAPAAGEADAARSSRDAAASVTDSPGQIGIAAATRGAKAAGGSMAISEEELSNHSFVPLWTKQPTEGPFRDAYFLPEGIFAVVHPLANSSAWRLIRYRLEDGLPMWIYEIEEPLKFPPVAYHYAPSGEEQRSDELYILQKDVVRCLDLRYGAEMWRIQLSFPVSCGPIVDETQYYIGSLDRKIYAMAKKKPYSLWPYITGGEIKAPGAIGSNGELYFTSTDKNVYRLEPTSGWVAGKSWSHATGGRIHGSPVFFSRWVIVGSTDFKLYSFEVDGTIAWEFPAESAIFGTPVVMSLRPDKPLVLCLSRDERRGQEKNMLSTLDAKTGEKLWQRPDVDQVIGIGRKAVYLLQGAPGGGRKIVAVEALKGEQLTTLPVDSFEVVPTNDADHGTNPKARGTIYLISKTGFMQAIREKL